LALLGVVLYFAKVFPQNLSGEGLYDFQFPYSDTFWDSWREFFIGRVRSRLMHGVFISAIYSITGYNPPAIYLSLWLFIVATATLIALTLRPYVRSGWVAVLLLIAFTWLPLNINDLVLSKKAHHILAWFLFWLAIFLFQRWVVGKRLGNLLGAALAFLGSILGYEVAAALLPVAVLFSLPYIKTRADFANKLGMALWISALAGLALINLEAIKPYGSLQETYTNAASPTSAVTNYLGGFPQIFTGMWDGYLLGEFLASDVIVWAVRLAILLGFGAAAYATWRFVQNRKKGALVLPLVLAGAWLVLFNYAPFALAGQPPDGDSLRGAAFALILFGLAGASALKPRLGFALVALICVTWTGIGLFAYQHQLSTSRDQDAVLRQFVISLKQQVPEVLEGTEFIFVNSGFGRTGCIGLLSMLYDREQLHCIHLLDGDREEMYVRNDDGLLEVGGRTHGERFIILLVAADGSAVLINEISAESLPLVAITWQSDEPLQMDFSLIQPLIFERNTAFYDYLTSH
jgi:hypothetical protein